MSHKAPGGAPLANVPAAGNAGIAAPGTTLAYLDRPAFRTLLEAGSRARILDVSEFGYDDLKRAVRVTRRA